MSEETESRKLNSEFIVELLKTCLVSEKVLSLCKEHLKYQYLETESQKMVYRYILEHQEINGRAPTVGLIGQSFPSNSEVLSLLSQIKKVNITESKDEIVSALELFLKEVRFILMYETLGDLYNEGKKKEAIKYGMEETSAIHEFSLKKSYYATVFQDFEQRQIQRAQAHNQESMKKTSKLVWGIRGLDNLTGGIGRARLACYMAKSGGGKSTAMRWTGLSNARLGERVVHFSQEGSEQEVMDAYDAAWTSIDLSAIHFGQIPENKKSGILKAHKAIIEGKGEIIVFAVSSFNSLTLLYCRSVLQDIVDNVGPVDLILWDYLELFNTGLKGSVNSEGMERKRREDSRHRVHGTNGIDYHNHGCGCR